MADTLVFYVQCRGCKKQLTIHREPDSRADFAATEQIKNSLARGIFACDSCPYGGSYQAREIFYHRLTRGCARMNIRLLFQTVCALFLILLPLGPASSGTIYVADPGTSFGPFIIGGQAPSGWATSCTDEPGTPLEATDFYYPEYGMEVSVYNQRIEYITVWEYPAVFPKLYAEHGGSCVSAEGNSITSERTFTLPLDAAYVTNKGVQLGATVNSVIAAHGAPTSTASRQGSVIRLSYCGLAFSFNRTGRVTMISIRQKSSRDCRTP